MSVLNPGWRVARFLILCSLLFAPVSIANETFLKKILPAAALVGGAGCAAYAASTDFGITAAAMVVTAGLTYGVNQLTHWCRRPEGPSLKDAIENPAEGANFSSSAQMVQFFEKAFKETTSFAVDDAKQFEGEIADGMTEQILAKATQRMTTSESVAFQKASQMGPTIATTANPAGALEKMAKAIATAKRGVCTTFAVLAAHILTRGGLENAVRVEVISRRETGGRAQASTHLFAVVGRAEGSDLSDPTSWGANARIVDLWLGALGNAFVYEPTDREYQAWLKNLNVVYSNKR